MKMLRLALLSSFIVETVKKIKELSTRLVSPFHTIKAAMGLLCGKPT
jgi:hypothetical protein